MATVIDALVVTLGLDARGFKGGVRRTQADLSAGTKKWVDENKKAGNQITDTLAEVARQATVLFLGFETFKGALNYFAGLNAATANLGRFSANLGQSAREVNTWNSAIELAGGSAQDSQKDLQLLSNSLTALRATGDVSPLLMLFQRMGVAIYDAQGRTRKLTDLYKDLGDKLRQYNRADAFNLAQQAGLSASTFNLIEAEASERDRLLRTAEANNTVTDEAIKKAEDLQEQWRTIGQTLKGVAVELLGDITPAIKEVFGWVQRLFTGIKNTGALQGIFLLLSASMKALSEYSKIAWDSISKIFNTLTNTKVGKWLIDKLSKLQTKAGSLGADFLEKELGLPTPGNTTPPPKPRTTSDYRAKIAETEKALGIPPGILDRLARTESNYNPNARNARTGATGIVQMLPKYFPNAGKDAFADIDEGGKYLLQLYRQFGSWELAAAAYNTGPGSLKKILAGTKALPRETKNYVNSIFGPNDNALAAARFAVNGAPEGDIRGSTSTTTVDIGTINVNAPNARNAADIAAELPGALKRKGIVAQADSGMS